MSHTIYSTDAIILKRVPTGEADATLWLLTKELGLIVARAQGARREVGKMRGYLQLYSAFKVSLVRGKHVWRITGAERREMTPTGECILQGEALVAFARVATFVRRMMLTDTQIGLEVFDTVLNARYALGKSDDVHWAELTAVAKILMSLGYIDAAVIKRIDSQKITKNELSKIVNSALTESHM